MARRRRTPRTSVRRVVLGVAVLVLVAFAAFVALAGSPDRLPSGTTIAGVDVGGLTPNAATQMLERRAARLERDPLELVAAGRTFRVTASQLGVRADWAGAVRTAAAATDGVGPIRGLKRIHARIFGSAVQPHVHVYPSVLRYKVGEIARAIDRPAVDASVVRRGLAFRVTPERSGLATRSRRGLGPDRRGARRAAAGRSRPAADGRRPRRRSRATSSLGRPGRPPRQSPRL